MGKRTPTREALERGRRIKSVRNCNHLTQEKMAEKMNISVSTVKKMESGENNITISELKYLRDEFDVSADYILFGDINDVKQCEYMFENVSGEEKLWLLMRLLSYLCSVDPSKLKSIIKNIVDHME